MVTNEVRIIQLQHRAETARTREESVRILMEYNARTLNIGRF